VTKNVVIVESPAKAKTIEGFLGKEFVVESSYGHIRDLSKKNMGIDIAANFKPNYEVSERSKKTISKLKQLTKKAQTVWLATDEDREGEAIAWHLAEELKLKPENSKRITFNEITKNAVQQAIKNPHHINVDLVNAQQARRVVDRLVGFELSPILWKKIRTGLSAGRVQSVSVRLLIDRKRERDNHISQTTWKIQSDLIFDSSPFKAVWQDGNAQEEEAKSILEKLRNEKLQVTNVELKPAKSSPSAPFTTSSLQQTAIRLLGYSVKRTMSLAQELYEQGAITYMRTDSVHLSNQALENCKSYVCEKFGNEYHQKRIYKAKLASAQEAHEAIRPTEFSHQHISSVSADAAKLYRIIWQRAVASQMADAKINKTKVQLGHQSLSNTFLATGEQVNFDGWLKVQGKAAKEIMLPKMEKGDHVEIEKIVAREVFSRPPARYNEGSLVRTLEELGIGRPSTYAPTISTIQDRGYVEKKDIEPHQRSYKSYCLEQGEIKAEELSENTGGDKQVLEPTDIAFIVNDFLVEHFPEVIDFQFTAKLEANFDHIANGKVQWENMVKDFYDPFHTQISLAENIDRQKINSARILGEDPESGKTLLVRMGRYGSFAQIGDSDAEEKPKYASLRPNQNLDTITFEQALELFSFPKVVGDATRSIFYKSIDDKEYKINTGTEIKTNVGRFGPYLQFEENNERIFVSIRGFTAEDITLDEAMELIDKHLSKKAAQLLAKIDNIEVLMGRWGPYLSDGVKMASLGKTIAVETLDKETAVSILEKRGKPIKKKATKKTTKTKKITKKITKKKP
jgi:DNA topoisomerase-1